MRRGVFVSMWGRLWVSGLVCGVFAVAAFFLGWVAGLVWLVCLAG
jgi:hypothetical protein